MFAYRSLEYVRSLGEFGEPRELRRSGSWALRRPIPASDKFDACGCYPLLCCADPSRLKEDLTEWNDCVSFVAVIDPFATDDPDVLRDYFADLCLPFKQHFVVETHKDWQAAITKHHHYYARRAQRELTVELCRDPAEFLDEWQRLYAVLVSRHQLKGIQAMSRAAFEWQLKTPGVFAFRALKGTETVGGQLWYVDGNVAYNHLAATSPLGYELCASYALYMAGLQELAPQVHWIDLGGAPGDLEDEANGLAQFKRGWSTGIRQAYLCGKILDVAGYQSLVSASDALEAKYFPAYRFHERT